MIELRAIPLSQIRPGSNDRKVFDADELAGLALSIEASGLATPIKVRPIAEWVGDECGRLLAGSPARFEIVAGERRFRAHQLLGRETIDAIVEDADDERASAQMLVENLQRKDLNPVEEANAYRKRMEQFGSTVEEVARIAGVGTARVRDRLKLLDLAPDVLHLTQTGQLSVWFATQLARLDVNRQIIGLRAFQRQPNMGWEQFSAMVEQLALEQGQDSMFDLDVFQVEEWLASQPKPERRRTRAELLTLIEKMAPSVWAVDRELGDAAFAVIEAEKRKTPTTAGG